jgi:hypothetical protein
MSYGWFFAGKFFSFSLREKAGMRASQLIDPHPSLSHFVTLRGREY